MIKNNTAQYADSWNILPEANDFSETIHDCRVMINSGGSYSYPQPEFVLQDELLPDRTLFKINRGQIDYDPIYAVRVSNATLIDDCTVITEENKVLTDLAIMNRRRSPLPPSSLAPTELKYNAPADIDYFDGSLALLFFHPASGHHHSHWLIQTLPKLELFLQTKAEFDKILVYDSIKPYQLNMLSALGITPDLVHVRNKLSPIKAKNLYLMYTWNDIMPHFESIDRLIDHYSDDSEIHERIYVSRQDARHIRKFINEEEIIDIAKSLDFEIIIPSKLTASDEVKIFRNAKFICGPLGAGLYNSYFTKAGAFITVIGDPCYVMDWMPQLCGLRGHRLGYYFGNSFYSYDRVHFGTHNNWILNPDRFKEALNLMISSAV